MTSTRPIIANSTKWTTGSLTLVSADNVRFNIDREVLMCGR
jgi:hypothetical protein